MEFYPKSATRRAQERCEDHTFTAGGSRAFENPGLELMLPKPYDTQARQRDGHLVAARTS
jgi:hypothetical protein